MTTNFKILKVVSGIIFSAIGLFLVSDNFIPIDKSKYLVEESKLKVLQGYLISKPYFHKSTGGKGSSNYFVIQLDTYPGLKFQNESIFLRATNWELINAEVKLNDTISIKVLKAEFETNYLKKDSMNIFQKIANYPFDKFQFYSFNFKNKEYMTDLYVAAKNHQQDKLFIQFLLGLGFIGMGIYSFFAKK